MKTILTNVGAIIAIGVFAIACSGQGPGITRTEMGGDGLVTPTPSRATRARISSSSREIQPGAGSGWHTHPGVEVAIIKSGTLTFFNGGRPEVRGEAYTAGQVVTGSGHAHQGRNLGTKPVEIVVTYFDVPPGGPAAVPAERPTQCPG